MKANSITYIGFVQDHSGSMKMFDRDVLAMSNFNEQRAKLLKEDDETMDNVVTVVEFDDEIHCNIDNTPISSIKEMDKWWTGGATALYDAIAYCIDLIKNKMKNDKREDKAALIIVQTDGQENSSTNYSGEEGRKKINERINELEGTKKWTFVFLGENIDKSTVVDLGFKMSNIMSHESGTRGIKAAYAATSNGLGEYFKSRKSGETQVFNFYNNNDTNINNDTK